MKKINLPQSIEDVKPEHNEFIATEILGWKKKKEADGKHEWYTWRNKNNWLMILGDANFFTDIQHSKILDELLSGNLHIEAYIRKSFCCYKIFGVIKKDGKLTHKLIADCISKHESFARTSAICKAWVELNK